MGAKTGINYYSLHYKTLKAILTKVKEREAEATALFKFHNTIVFAGVVGMVKSVKAAGGNQEGDASDSSGIDHFVGGSDVEGFKEVSFCRFWREGFFQNCYRPWESLIMLKHER